MSDLREKCVAWVQDHAGGGGLLNQKDPVSDLLAFVNDAVKEERSQWLAQVAKVRAYFGKLVPDKDLLGGSYFDRAREFFDFVEEKAKRK